MDETIAERIVNDMVVMKEILNELGARAKENVELDTDEDVRCINVERDSWHSLEKYYHLHVKKR